MVFKKKADYGFNGFRVPVIPKAPRSARRRGPFRNSVEDGQACAFDLLASLAGKLLQESESSAASNASEGNLQPAVKPLTMEGIRQGNCAESVVKNEVASQNSSQKPLLHSKPDCLVGYVSVNNSSDCLEKVETGVKTEAFDRDKKYVHYSNRLVEIHEKFKDSCDGIIKNGFRQGKEAGSSDFQGSTLGDKYGLKDQLDLYATPALIDSKVNVKYPRKSFPSASFSKLGNGSKLEFRDDDENLLRCKRLCTKSKAFRSPRRIAHRRIKNLLSSKYWKVAPKLKECDLPVSEFADLGVPLYRKRKACYGFERSQRSTIAKRRKFFDHVSGVTSDGGFSSESVSNSPMKGVDGDKPCSSAKLLVPQDSHVKFSIKSFKIPELYIEVPETATVGSLKRSVMESVMAILGGGVHVGVILQGKKVREDNRTLMQTGISCKENLDTLSFTLEPSSLLASPAVCVGGGPSSQCETFEPIGSPETPVLDSGITGTLLDPSLLTNPSNLVESNHESTSSPTDTTVDNITPDSRAIVAVPTSAEALAVVPASQKTKRADYAQRRTRRPFTVYEVEALVHAVEELGTGRWRDVKLRSFENADHRTYVDLKDKWKTLVHTASISPQQRRGEPVPQELLDRVLAAHSYWSQHQAKQHGKPQVGPGTLKIAEAAPERSCLLKV